MSARTKFIVGTLGVLLLLSVIIFLQTHFSEFLSTRAPIDTSSPAERGEYSAICEETCVDFTGSEQQECINNCLELGSEYY